MSADAGSVAFLVNRLKDSLSAFAKAVCLTDEGPMRADNGGMPTGAAAEAGMSMGLMAWPDSRAAAEAVR
jgi:hypothetical protein